MLLIPKKGSAPTKRQPPSTKNTLLAITAILCFGDSLFIGATVTRGVLSVAEEEIFTLCLSQYDTVFSKLKEFNG